jgi:hypothetical protein
MCDFLHGKSHVVPGFPPTSTGNPGSVYTNCETALIESARSAHAASGWRALVTFGQRDQVQVGVNVRNRVCAEPGQPSTVIF